MNRGVFNIKPVIDELTSSRLKQLLIKLSKNIRLQDEMPEPLKNIMGVDVAYKDERALTVGVLFSWPELKHQSTFHRIDRVFFPYIPTLLSFREGNLIIRFLKNLSLKPDLLMVNAHGVAHPFRCGCASYIGLLTDTPTIGVAKKIICGEIIKSEEGGNIAYLKYYDKIIGAVLNHNKKSREIVVSPGHRISLKTAVQITLTTLKDSRLPIILEEAHRMASKLASELFKHTN
ncbi:MAG: endonuclease V [Candidatus Odinarchaeum yellowstonii]|uniref:Endonuclease V n=1 Tax=Odinarchaeota yellowstonii (strain LCB_4) TaxID=1841599 RepID=A0AAF0D3C9_ODILC|nr:MAG: endonuclease V [Candidatus Odinarchaeum yellowstonii]